MIKRKIYLIFLMTVISFVAGPKCVKADEWNAYVEQAKATQRTLSGSYADEIITLNQTALIDQAALIHHFATAYPNPLTSQATADWAAVNMISSFNDPYARAITCNPYFYYTYNCFYPYR